MIKRKYKLSVFARSAMAKITIGDTVLVDGKIETVPYTTQTGRTLEVIDGEIDFEFDSKILVPVVVELSSGFLEVETIYWDYG